MLMDEFFNTRGGGGFGSAFAQIDAAFATAAAASNGGMGGSNVKRTSTSTRFVNGKKITTKK